MSLALVTGVTGTLGTTLLKGLLEEHEVVGYSRCELKQSQIPPHKNLTLYLGDVRDRDRLIEASRECDIIYHLSALKQIDRLELNPEESIATNITGTENVLHCQRVNKIPRVVFSSTDKACAPWNVYGMCKAISERLVMRNPNNIVCRWGNIIASRGSVIPKFIETLKKEKTLYITERGMTRFFLRPVDVAAFMLRVSQRPIGGLCIPPMKAYPVLKLGLLLADMLDIKTPRILEIGMRPGEKLHEIVRMQDEGGLLESSDKEHWYSENEMRELLGELL